MQTASSTSLTLHRLSVLKTISRFIALSREQIWAVHQFGGDVRVHFHSVLMRVRVCVDMDLHTCVYAGECLRLPQPKCVSW